MKGARHIARVAIAAIGSLAALGGLTACAPNEAKLCGTTSENAGASCTATYSLCKGGSDRLADTLKKRAAAGCGWDILDDATK